VARRTPAISLRLPSRPGSAAFPDGGLPAGSSKGFFSASAVGKQPCVLPVYSAGNAKAIGMRWCRKDRLCGSETSPKKVKDQSLAAY
jgi:hypothetical protein